MDDMADPYRIAPFTVSSFSSHALAILPPMDPQDSALFLESLKARTVPELVVTARLWECKLLQLYRVPFFLVRVGDIRAALKSPATALILYKEAQEQIESDPVFDKFVANLEQRCLADEKKHRLSWSQGVFNQPWQGTSQYRFPILPRAPEQMPDIQDHWAAIRGQPREKQYIRYLVIESNLLELTFTLTRNSIKRLTRDGFEEDAVEFLPDSALQDNAIIVEILRDTLQAMDLVLSIAHDISNLTVDLLYELHSICMRTTNILPIATKGGNDSTTQAQAKTVEYELKYTNINVTREATKKNVVIAGPPRVQFCPFDDIIEELGRFVHLARQWLKNWPRNPFASAAWFHLIIATIHPFENGNGRVARMIASIPLIKADLPPLCISSDAVLKKDYFESLGKARDNNYPPLVQNFVQSLEASIEAIEDLE
jgi:hypothetical protein